MFLKCGCGCVVIVVESTAFREPVNWTVRLVDYCGGDSDGVLIGPEHRLGERIIPENIKTMRFLSAEEYKPYLDQMSKLITQGHLFGRLKSVLKPFLT
jgi:hypothetical protein